MGRILKSIISFFEKLSSKPKIGGLQITDSAVQYVLPDGEGVRNFALKLPPGILEQGKLKDKEGFVKILRELHSLILPDLAGAPLKVIVVLPTELVYTQSFGVPNITPEKLAEAARLNLQMISPITSPHAYMSYQVIGETQDRYELLGAFAEKNVVDEYRLALQAVGFEPIIFEFPALALSRIVNQAVGVAKEPLLILQISGDGLDLFLFRDSSLHFDYFRSWKSIQGDAREISKDAFEAVIVEEVQKVVNFALSRFKEVPREAFLIMPGFEEEVKKLLEERFNFKTSPLLIKSPLGPNWYAALGAASRGALNPADDVFIALGVSGAMTVFYEERLLNFVRLWRNILVVVLGLFLIVFAVSAAYLVGQTKSLDAQLSNISVQASDKELADLESKVQEFNDLVKAIAQVRGSPSPWLVFLQRLTDLAKANNVVLGQFAVSAFGTPVTLTAQAPDHDSVIRFKNVLAAEPGFSAVDLPLSQIITLPDNSVSFSITFQYSPPQ